MEKHVLYHALIIIKWQYDKYRKSYQEPETVEHIASGCIPYLVTHTECAGVTHPEIVISRLGRENGPIVKQTTELMNEWMNERVKETKNGRTNKKKRTREWMNEWMSEWNSSSLWTSNMHNTLLEYTRVVFLKRDCANLYWNKTRTCVEAMDTQI